MEKKENKIYNKEKFIEEYKLTKDECYLLPEDERMQYSKREFGFVLDSIPNNGDVLSLRGTLPCQHIKFFERHCCRVQYFDFGLEETEIQRIGRYATEYQYVEEANNRLDEYIKLVSSVKANMFENILKDIYMAKINGLSTNSSIPLEVIKEEILKEVCSGFLSQADLPDDIKEQIMQSELSLVFKRVEEEGSSIIDAGISDYYLEYLETLGYECQKNGREYRVKNKTLAKK